MFKFVQHKSTEYLYLATRQIKEGNAQPSGFWCVLWSKRIQYTNPVRKIHPRMSL